VEHIQLTFTALEDLPMVAAKYTIHRHHCHHTWDKTHAPVLTVAPNESITFDVTDASAGQVTQTSTADVFATYDSARVNPVTGPVFVDGAQPGDILCVRILSYAPSGWGWTANIPGFGLLADDFPEAALHHWNYDPTGSAPLLYGENARIPLAPFAGTIGVAPAAPGPHDIIPPRHVGGNMDIRNLIAGSALYLPVEVEGALLSIGDTHAAQGDGEVCGTALESPMRVTATLDLIKDRPLAMPRLDCPARPAVTAPATPQNRRVWITSGIGPDLHDAARASVHGMIDLLAQEHGLPAIDAYMLCSVAGDLKISQIVDAPNWTVTFHMPQSIFA
jgi:acetamidase/formamidase